MGLVQMRQFGKMGRFANQLFEYGFLKTYAARYGADVQLPPWCGNQLFGLVDDPPLAQLSIWHEHEGDDGQPIPPVGAELLERDFLGWAQYHTSFYSLTEREAWRVNFQPVPAVTARLESAASGFASGGVTRVGVHLRRGDYGQSIFAITPVSWYLQTLAAIWPTLDRPCLFVATEDASLVKEFSDYSPITIETLGVDLVAEPLANFEYLPHDRESRDPRAMDFYPEFYLLTQCNVLLAPNSTFSFAAAMMAPQLKALYRSNIRIAGFEAIDPWNAYPLHRDKVEDFPHVPGIRLERNRYWEPH